MILNRKHRQLETRERAEGGVVPVSWRYQVNEMSVVDGLTKRMSPVIGVVMGLNSSSTKAEPQVHHDPGVTYVCCQHERCACSMNFHGDEPLSVTLAKWRDLHG